MRSTCPSGQVAQDLFRQMDLHRNSLIFTVRIVSPPVQVGERATRDLVQQVCHIKTLTYLLSNCYQSRKTKLLKISMFSQK
jgi:hypothetical protein